MPNPFDFGDVAVCERCATTMPLSEAHMIRRIIYDDANPNAADATRTKYYLCPRCFQSVQQKNQWIGIRHWLLLGGAGLVGLILLMCAVLYANRLR